MPPPLRLSNASEQQVLDHPTVRLITEAERPRWNAEVTAHHIISGMPRWSASPSVT
jgi:hypothetical protein